MAPRQGLHGRDGRRANFPIGAGHRPGPEKSGASPTPRQGLCPALVHRFAGSASLDSGFAHNVGRLRAGALRPPGACPKIAPATFPVERSGDFFIQVQKKKGST